MNKIGLIVLFACASTCFAQTSSTPAPAGNPTTFPAKDASWTVNVTYKDAASPSPSVPAPTDKRPKTINITQKDGVRRTVVTRLTGQSFEQWHYPDLQTTFTTDTPNGMAVYIRDSDLEAQTAMATGFEPAFFSWIDPKNFTGVVKYEGRPAYHYKATVKLGEGRTIANGSGRVYSEATFEAWIDLETLRPVGLDDGVKLGVFQFGDPPTAPMTPPKAIANAYLRQTTPLVTRP